MNSSPTSLIMKTKSINCETSKIIQIKFNGFKTERVSHPEIQAIYLQGWIAAQLGLEFPFLEYNDDLWRNIICPIGDAYRSNLFPQLNPSQAPGSIISTEVSCMGDISSSSYAKTTSLKQLCILPRETIAKCHSPALPDIRKGHFLCRNSFTDEPAPIITTCLSLIAQYDCQKQH